MDNNELHSNPFKKLAESHVPPKRLKKKVLASAKFSYMVLCTLDLFINKPLAAIDALFKTGNNNNNK